MNEERPIEKLLRRYAKKRRDDTSAPVEMHPATRRMLQGEVARQFPRCNSRKERDPKTFADVWALWRRQLIWAVPVFLVVLIGVWALVGPGEKPQESFELASKDLPATMTVTAFKSPAAPAPVMASPAPSASPQPALVFADRPTSRGAGGDSEKRDGNSLDNTVVAGDSKPSVPATIAGLAATSKDDSRLNFESTPTASYGLQTPARELLDKGTADGLKAGALHGELAKTKTVPPPTEDESLKNLQEIRKDYVAANVVRVTNSATGAMLGLALNESARFYRQAGDERDRGQAFSQVFVNQAAPTYGKTKVSEKITPVLANFQLQKRGNQLRVIDGDGSTYVGEMRMVAEKAPAKVEMEKKGGGIRLKSAKATSDRQQQAATRVKEEAQNFACRVEGTNRTLNQQVIFSWNFVPPTNAWASAEAKSPSGGGNLFYENTPAQQFPALNNAAIQGRAQLGDTKEIEVNAVPASQ